MRARKAPLSSSLNNRNRAPSSTARTSIGLQRISSPRLLRSSGTRNSSFQSHFSAQRTTPYQSSRLFALATPTNSPLPKKIKIVDVGPRDGLQNEKKTLTTELKVELINRLTKAGVPVVEAGSFVSPKWIPQMADSGEVFKRIEKRADTSYPVLVPNMVGFEAAKAVGVKEIAVFASASESFSKKNINCTIKESFERFKPVMDAALQSNIKVRGYVSCVLGCPYEGEITPQAVADVSRTLHQMGCYEISLGDTIGIGTPGSTLQMIQVVKQEVPIDNLAVHFHNTYGQALANILIALQNGVAVIDSSIGGLGGCPYAGGGATGNVPTEDVVYMLQGLGYNTGINLEALVATAQFITAALGTSPRSFYSSATAKKNSKAEAKKNTTEAKNDESSSANGKSDANDKKAGPQV